VPLIPACGGAHPWRRPLSRSQLPPPFAGRCPSLGRAGLFQRFVLDVVLVGVRFAREARFRGSGIVPL